MKDIDKMLLTSLLSSLTEKYSVQEIKQTLEEIVYVPEKCKVHSYKNVAVGAYAFAYKGKIIFADKLEAHNNCIGVVAYLGRSNSLQPKGMIVALSEENLPWSDSHVYDLKIESDSGWDNTLELHNQKNRKRYVAVEYCCNYAPYGIRGWFLPSVEEVRLAFDIFKKLGTGKKLWTSNIEQELDVRNEGLGKAMYVDLGNKKRRKLTETPQVKLAVRPCISF